jgi:flagellin-like protein
MEKRGLSPVIAVVLLLLVTIISVTIIVAFVIPFVRENLETGGECFDVIGDLSFAETPYNCYVSDTATGFSVRIDDDNIIGFRIGLEAVGSSTARDIEPDNEGYLDLRMLSGESSEYGNILLIPGRGEVRTYVSDAVYDRAELFAILKSGSKCELADDIIINVCDDTEVALLIQG